MNPNDLTQWPEDVLKQLLKACEKEKDDLINEIVIREANIETATTEGIVRLDSLTEWRHKVEERRTQLDLLAQSYVALKMAIESKHQTV